MTIPSERTRAVLYTEQFLLALCDPKKSPRVPARIRDQAKNLLRHYPTRYEMEILSIREENTDCLTSHRIFGRIE